MFFLAAVIGSFALAFSNWSVTEPDRIGFVGLDNISSLLSDSQFRAAIKNTFTFSIWTSLIKLVLGLLLALVLNQRFVGREATRALFFMPYLLSAYAIGFTFTFILNPTTGLLNALLANVHLSQLAKDWLGDPSLALWSAVGVDVWIGTGFSATILLAGLQSVPEELKDAAAVDGAGRWAIARFVTIPFLLPVLSIVLVLNLIWGFRVFDLVQALTQGGPGWATEVVTTMLYKSTTVGALGYSAAIGLTQFLLIALICIPLLGAFRRREIEL